MDIIKFDNLDEFKNKIADISNVYADTAEKHLKRCGNKLKKELKENSPDSGYDHKNKLKDSWKSEVSGLTGDELSYRLYSKAPHFHLVDRGHTMMTKTGKVVGYVQGTHFLDKTVKQFEAEGTIEKELTSFAKDIKHKIEES